MNLQDALHFLEAHQPLPDNAPPELIDQLKEVVVYLYENPNVACIPLLLRCFAEWDNWTLYDSIQSVLKLFPMEKVIPHLISGLKCSKTIRLWCADTARYFPSNELIDALAPLLQEGSSDLRLVAATALENIEDPRVVALAVEHALHETDNEVLEVYLSIHHAQGGANG